MFKKIRELMAAVAFAEAGEFDEARRLVEEASEEPAKLEIPASQELVQAAS